MSSAGGGEALRERLTVCSLVLPVLNLPALLVGLGLGVDVVGVIADVFHYSELPNIQFCVAVVET